MVSAAAECTPSMNSVRMAEDFAAELTAGVPGAYANFLGTDGEDRIREAYPGSTWDRLTAVKTRWDPANVFHLNQNIPPA